MLVWRGIRPILQRLRVELIRLRRERPNHRRRQGDQLQERKCSERDDWEGQLSRHEYPACGVGLVRRTRDLRRLCHPYNRQSEQHGFHRPVTQWMHGAKCNRARDQQKYKNASGDLIESRNCWNCFAHGTAVEHAIAIRSAEQVISSADARLLRQAIQLSSGRESGAESRVSSPSEVSSDL